MRTQAFADTLGLLGGGGHKIIGRVESMGRIGNRTIPMAIPVAIPYHGNARCRSVPIIDTLSCLALAIVC